MKITEMKERLQGELTGFRYEHTLGVEYTSACLALRYGADMEKARIAGLLHDCAKCIPTEQKRKLSVTIRTPCSQLPGADISAPYICMN